MRRNIFGSWGVGLVAYQIYFFCRKGGVVKMLKLGNKLKNPLPQSGNGFLEIRVSKIKSLVYSI
jgi:hypothetical protein